ncbi:hypothetical protein [Streptomyces zagrosensis]|uniref:Uncharacterized protein n=1 Tax=Streptomyces zagrosensis TaxID=1042984 RepID=A0A7W9QFW7_9ACTN|nr:hypothetical protein [Streptomyces zagrosensis]MBB5939244.1 hypothetical protein [Streptomyces zagrosensis]
MTANVVSRQVVEILVDYNGFCLQEEDDEQVPIAYPEGRAELGTAFLVSHQSRVDVESAGHTHFSPLTVEVWDGEPPIDSSQVWEEKGEVTLASATGRLAVWVIAGPEEERIELGRAQVTWHLRMYSAGREEVARLAEFEVPEGVERYLAHFWEAE